MIQARTDTDQEEDVVDEEDEKIIDYETERSSVDPFDRAGTPTGQLGGPQSSFRYAHS